LAGKSIGAPGASFPRLIFPLLAERTGLDLARVKWMNLRPGSLLEALISAKVKAVASYTTVLWQYQRAAKKAGLRVVSLPYADYGLNLYSLSLVTTDFRIQDKEPMVRRFVGATYRGLAWAAEHPREALALFLKERPGLERERVEAEWREALRLMLPEGAPARGFGRYERRRLAELKSVMVRWRHVKMELPLERLYTNDYLPALTVKPKRF
ncbi:MAG: ABC transporter substrate-binding protein, partial [Nitrospinota bacterium]